MNTQESGRSMVEMLGVIAIIGVLAVGGFSSVKYGMDAYQAAWAFQLVEDTAQGVNDLYSWSRSLPTSSAAVNMRNRICENDILEEDCDEEFKTKASINTTWGKFQVEADTKTSFLMTLTNVPKRVCARLKGMNWSENIEWEPPENCQDSNDLVFTAF